MNFTAIFYHVSWLWFCDYSIKMKQTGACHEAELFIFTSKLKFSFCFIVRKLHVKCHIPLYKKDDSTCINKNQRGYINIRLKSVLIYFISSWLWWCCCVFLCLPVGGDTDWCLYISEDLMISDTRVLLKVPAHRKSYFGYIDNKRPCVKTQVTLSVLRVCLIITSDCITFTSFTWEDSPSPVYHWHLHFLMCINISHGEPLCICYVMIM